MPERLSDEQLDFIAQSTWASRRIPLFHGDDLGDLTISDIAQELQAAREAMNALVDQVTEAAMGEQHEKAENARLREALAEAQRRITTQYMASGGPARIAYYRSADIVREVREGVEGDA